MVERFIRCRSCNQVLPVPSFFGDFGDPAPLPGVEWSNEDEDFHREFACAHAHHPREELRIDPESFFSEKPGYEPVKTSYFEATNGRERFLIKRTKPGLANPARYEVLSGRMEITTRSIEIQEADLRKQVFSEPGAALLPPEKLDVFIQALREEAAAISPGRLFEAIAATAEGDSPRILYAALKEDRWQKILERCARNLHPPELGWVRQFIQDHRQPGDVLSLLVHRGVSFLSEGSPSLPDSEVSALHP
jgi:hypothetical protein